jgi:hypothetical protein
MSQTDRKLDEMNSKLEKIVKNTEGPGLGEKIYHAYDKAIENGTKKTRKHIDEGRRKQGRSEEVSKAQDILGGSLVLVGLVIVVFCMGAQYPSHYYGPMSLGFGLFVVGAIIIRL